jgi:succinate-acetate transporter protein
MIKWIILGGFSISLLAISLINVYLFVNRSIWYIIIGLSSFCIFMYLYCCIYSHILKNINKKNWDNILSRILIIYAIFTDVISSLRNLPVLFIAIGYGFLSIVLPYLVIKYTDKNNNHELEEFK